MYLRLTSHGSPQEEYSGPRGSNRYEIDFKDVYQDGHADEKYEIFCSPLGDGKFYILRCDDHRILFRQTALCGAAEHLRSNACGHMATYQFTATPAEIIGCLGIEVKNCTVELKTVNNEVFRKVIEEGHEPRGSMYRYYSCHPSEQPSKGRSQSSSVQQFKLHNSWVLSDGALQKQIGIVPSSTLQPQDEARPLVFTATHPVPDARDPGSSTAVPLPRPILPKLMPPCQKSTEAQPGRGASSGSGYPCSSRLDRVAEIGCALVSSGRQSDAGVISDNSLRRYRMSSASRDGYSQPTHESPNRWILPPIAGHASYEGHGWPSGS